MKRFKTAGSGYKIQAPGQKAGLDGTCEGSKGLNSTLDIDSG